MLKIHLADAKFRNRSLHFDIRVGPKNTTEDLAKVTCKRCLAMLERQKKWEGR